MRLLLGVLLAVLSSGTLTTRLLLDGPEGVIFSALFEDDTELAPGYSDLGFLVVRPGMSQAQVHRILGAPLDCWESPAEGEREPERAERWSRSPHDSNYFCRVVRFRAGRVTSKQSEFYVD